MASESSASTSSRFATRLATDDDLEHVITACSEALGWLDPEFDEALFRWKHLSNAFGRSLILVATDSEFDHEVVAVRTFMRWRFATPDGTTVTAARAVDTATVPAAQGHGLFTQLTTAGLAMLDNEGVGFIFNTPNARSLSGYLKIGWFPAGEVAFGYGVRSPGSIPRLTRSRVAAEKPSLATPDLGVPVADGLGELAKIETANRSARLWTDHSLDTLLWRYCGGPISYRFIPIAKDAGLIGRVRRRGEIRELLVAEILGSPSDKLLSTSIRDAMRATDADIAITAPGVPGTIRVPKIGPDLALRSLNRPVTPPQFGWAPGDIELF